MKENPFLSPRPISLPRREASALDYRVIEFRHAGRARYVGDCRMDGSHEGDKSVRVFFRPPQNRANDIRLPDQPVAPDNADMFLTQLGLAAVKVPAALSDPCVIDLETADQSTEPIAIGGIY
ncbi:hypothetical protein [Verrucomicrobium spinosum]|uniref:hypothetical protein n=1 Tax=Verrucomicrobium spinosum TaxID=2736 RepID=UPI00017446E8|nr:hypothetical protein [Verrucomicrobium spinosum]